MLLAIDVGNTNLTLGVFRGDELLHDWRLKTDRDQTVDGWGVLIRNLLMLADLSASEINGIVIASVVPSLNNSLRRMAERYFQRTPLLLDSTVDTGLTIAIDNPAELGADRIANSVAAFKRFGGPCVAVDFGTAINFDVVQADGSYVGGLLCAGVEVAAKALFSNTAKLPQIEVTRPAKLIGTSTVSALQSGLFYGSLGLLDGILERLLAELGPDTKIVGTGGQAHVICPSSRYVQEVDEHLTLKGLRLIWERVNR
ncbi:MAG: type III pantothenate kinase [Acidobacteria bacterium]|nr:type III pantothenate kinase [Acidobacteriota bacterium]MDA1236490.1 type III pantothenate kinase [Acidobacteriota bacterium]